MEKNETTEKKGKQEATSSKPKDADTYDPFEERDIKKPINDWEAFVHFVKVALGVGVLSLPYGYYTVGLILGLIGTVFIAILCGHCNYMLVQTAHKLYIKMETPTMTYMEVIDGAFKNGPDKYKKFANSVRIFCMISLLCIYFGSCCVFTIVIAENVNEVVGYEKLTLRMYIAMCLPILIIFCFIPALKYMVPISLIANIFFLIAVAVLFYKLIEVFPSSLNDRRLYEWRGLHIFCPICIFSFQTIAHVMLVENEMKNPKHLLGIFGVMPLAQVVVAIFYSAIGFLGYASTGDEVKSIITLNFEDSWESIVIQLCMSMAVLGTFSLMILVAIQLVWKATSNWFGRHEKIGLTTIRLVFPTCAIILSLVVPSVLPFIGLMSAILLSILGFILPAIADSLVRTGSEFGFLKWRLIKNILIIIFGLISLVIGTYASIQEIIELYS